MPIRSRPPLPPQVEAPSPAEGRRLRGPSGGHRIGPRRFAVALVLGLVAPWAAFAPAVRAQGFDEAPVPSLPIRTGALHTVTVGTENLNESVRFYRDALGLAAVGPVVLSGRLDDRLQRQWGITERWSMYLFQRNGAPDALQVRLLYYARPGKVARISSDPREPGPYGLVFPTPDFARWDAEMRRAGLVSLLSAGTERRQVRPDGAADRFLEAVFLGPDRVQADLLAPFEVPPPAAADAAARLGPTSVLLVTAGADRLISFFVQGLGLELKSDREGSAADWPALGLGPAVRFRHLRIGASGQESGTVEILDLGPRALPSLSTPPRPPARGLSILSFPVTNLEGLLDRLRSLGFRDQQPPSNAAVPGLDSARIATVDAPNGMLVELFERVTPP